MRPFDFLLLEKLIGKDTVSDTALELGTDRRHIMHWRAVGLEEGEARELAVRAGFEPGEVWDELNGSGPGPADPEPAKPVGRKPSRAEVPAEVRNRPAAAAKADADDEIVWCDPPTRGNAGIRPLWLGLLGPLLERPGEWARIHVTTKKKAHTAANTLRSGRTAKPPGRWEFAGRTLPDDPERGGVWARYLGPDE